MIIIIAGSSHTGKTYLAQRLLEAHKYPYLSIDHLKMGLIRSGQTPLTSEDDDKLTEYLWPIVREMIKTAIENKQNLIIEGCYVPFDYKKDFSEEYLAHIKYTCLIFSEKYLNQNYDNIMAHSNVIESRLESNYSKELMLNDNRKALTECKKHGCEYVLIKADYFAELKNISCTPPTYSY